MAVCKSRIYIAETLFNNLSDQKTTRLPAATEDQRLAPKPRAVVERKPQGEAGKRTARQRRRRRCFPGRDDGKRRAAAAGLEGPGGVFRFEGKVRLVQTPGGFEIPPIDLKSVSAALGIHVQRDKRDSTFYPRRGSLLDVIGDFFAKGLGSRRQYQTYKISYQLYHELEPKQILAYRGMMCSANQNVPFYDLCLYGTQSNLRGYTGGEFQNRRMFATQAEYRRELKGRFGVVAFGGIGGVARRWNAFRSDELLPAAGAGLRFTLDKKNHINYRIDLAVGREGRTLSIGVGEAF